MLTDRFRITFGELGDRAPDDPRLSLLADRVATFIEAAAAEAEGVQDEHPLSDRVVALLDSAFVEFFPCAPPLFRLPEERGWTNIGRKDRAR